MSATALPRAQWTGWSCVSGPEELVNIIKIAEHELTYGSAIRRMDLKAGPVWWPGMPKDWSACYWLARLPSGAAVYVLQHGGIEYIFTGPGVDFDAAAEGFLAKRIEGAVDMLQDRGELPNVHMSSLTPSQLDIARSMILRQQM